MSIAKETERRTTSAVTVVMSFKLLPGREDIWRDAWSEIARLAACRPACRHSRLLQDQKDVGRFAMLSDWDSLPEFDRFAREVGLIWLDRARAYARTPPQINIFELIQDGASPRVLAEEAMALA